jgi:hypothetical protein
MDSMVQGVVVFSPFSFTLHAFTRHQERHRSSLSGSLKLSLCDRERPEPASGIFISSFFQSSRTTPTELFYSQTHENNTLTQFKE